MNATFNNIMIYILAINASEFNNIINFIIHLYLQSIKFILYIKVGWRWCSTARWSLQENILSHWHSYWLSSSFLQVTNHTFFPFYVSPWFIFHNFCIFFSLKSIYFWYFFICSYILSCRYDYEIWSKFRTTL